MDSAPGESALRLWDWPVRIVHWSLVVLMPMLWSTWKSGNMHLHEQLGYATLALVLFRLLWGVFGSSTARFAGFVKGPRVIAGYLRSGRDPQTEPVVGHNPLGGWSVVLLLGLLVALVTSGLFTQDVDGLESGPLTSLISYDAAEAARHWHRLAFNLTLGMIALHLAAIAFYLIARRENLVTPMFTGRRRYPQTVPAPRIAAAWLAALLAVVACLVTWWLSRGAPI